MKKILALVAALSVVMSLVAGGSIAYLTDTAADKNTMTLGKVEIEQIEQERDENGALVDFTQSKPLYPAVFAGSSIPWADAGNWVTPNDEAWKVVADNDNVVDKFVTVKNTGKSEAYVRTIIAYEGDETYGPNGAYIHVVHNTTNVDPDILFEDLGVLEIDGVNYTVFVYTYPEALAAGATSIPSLKQVYMNKAADNDVVEKYGDTYDILVLSQAVQTAGFDDAQTALDTAFGDVNAANAAEWFGDAVEESLKVPFDGTDKAALVKAINDVNDGTILVFQNNVTIAGYAATEKLIIEKNVTLDLNGKTLTTESGWGGIDLKGGASIINGTINHTGNTAAIKAFQVGKIENVTINVTETAGKTKGGIVVQEGAGCYVGSIKNVTINGATNGIETYKCGDRTDKAIGSMENVTINALDTGILLSAPIGTVSNSTIKGNNIGINAYLYGSYSVTMDLVNTKVEGANAGLYAHDEVGKTNPGSLAITYDAASNISKITEEFEAEVSGRASVTQK